MLHQVTIVPTLTNKKWTSKELPVKAGEKLDVIIKEMDNKLVCRNEEGKSEYLLLVMTKTHLISAPLSHLSNICSVLGFFTVGYVSTCHVVME